jgi:hypothetical protein
MNRVEKDKAIRSGNVLLYLESSYRSLARWKIVLYYSLFILPAISLALIGAVCGASLDTCILLFILGLPSVVIIHEFLKEASERPLGMVVTDEGVSLGPSCCGFWQEIKAWDFRHYSCLGRFSNDDNGKISLCLFVDDLNIDHGQFNAGRAGSAFAARGYFLNEKQQEEWKQICSERGIPRCL